MTQSHTPRKCKNPNCAPFSGDKWETRSYQMFFDMAHDYLSVLFLTEPEYEWDI